MNREVHVQFCEGLAGKFRWSTQQSCVSMKMMAQPDYMVAIVCCNYVNDTKWRVSDTPTSASPACGSVDDRDENNSRELFNA